MSIVLNDSKETTTLEDTHVLVNLYIIIYHIVDVSRHQVEIGTNRQFLVYLDPSSSLQILSTSMQKLIL